MQGDPKVDELMRPVLEAIKRHLKDSDAKTDIYNRAYEALMISMEVNKSRAEKAEAKVVELEQELEDTKTAGLKDANLAIHLYTKNKELESSLAALREQMRWIPVGERLPEIDTLILTFDSDGDIKSDFRSFNPICDNVTHWRPIDLPEIDKEGKE